MFRTMRLSPLLIVAIALRLGAQLFKYKARIDVVHVPYKGVPEFMTDTVSGRIHYAMTAVLSSIPMLREGRLIALGVTARERIALLPDVPTIAEAGVPGYEYLGWWGVLVPAKTPRAITDKLGGEIRRIVDLPEIKERVVAIGAHARYSTADEFAKLIRTEFENRGRIFKAAGAKVG